MDEIALWAQLKAGEKAALEAIYRSQVDQLFRYGCKFSKDEGLVKDSIQDLFIELWRNHKGLGATNSVKKYLLAALRRKIIKTQGKQKRWLLKDQTNAIDFELDMAPEELIINEEVSAEQIKLVKNAFEQLSKRQKEAIYLKFYVGLDYEEIGEIMDINYQSIRNLVSKALKNMKQKIGDILLVLFFLENFSTFFEYKNTIGDLLS